MMTRREAIKSTVLAGAALAALSGADAQTASAPAATGGPFTVPPLPYAYNALEPYIDARTMQIHHNKHHAAYVANLNKAVAEYPELEKKSIEEMLKGTQCHPGENSRRSPKQWRRRLQSHSLLANAQKGRRRT